MPRITKTKKSLGDRVVDAAGQVQQGVKAARDYQKEQELLAQQRSQIANKRFELEEQAKDNLFQKQKWELTTGLDTWAKGIKSGNSKQLQAAGKLLKMTPEEVDNIQQIDGDALSDMFLKGDASIQSASDFGKAGDFQGAIGEIQRGLSDIDKVKLNLTDSQRQKYKQTMMKSLDRYEALEKDRINNVAKREASADTGVNAVLNPIDKKNQEARGTGFAETHQRRTAELPSYQQVVSDNETLFSILKSGDVSTGFAAGSGPGLFAQRLFGDNNVKNKIDLMEQILETGFVQKILDVSEVAGAKAADSEGEKKVLKAVVASSKKTPEAAMAVNTIQAARAQRKIALQKDFADYQQSGETLLNYREPEFNTYYNDSGTVVAIIDGQKPEEGFRPTSEAMSRAMASLEGKGKPEGPAPSSIKVVDKHGFGDLK